MRETDRDRGQGEGEEEGARVQRRRRERKDVEGMFSLVSVLLTVRELLCQIQLLPNRFTQDTESWLKFLYGCVSEAISSLTCSMSSIQYAHVSLLIVCSHTLMCLFVCWCDPSVWRANTRTQETAREHKQRYEENKGREEDTTICLLKPPLLYKHLFFVKHGYVQAIWVSAHYSWQIEMPLGSFGAC